MNDTRHDASPNLTPIPGRCMLKSAHKVGGYGLHVCGEARWACDTSLGCSVASETILLADDEEAVRRFIRTVLENWGYQVLEARNGREGITLCGNHQGPIHLLFTDILMPEMGGRELAERTRLLYPEIKVLFTSGHPNDVLTPGGIKRRGISFLQKPFSIQELGRVVSDLLGGTKAEAASTS
jgi:CheY-like chemotaxis protein